LKEPFQTSRRNLPIRKRIVAGLVLLLVIVLAAGFRSQILTGLADFLIVDDPLQKAQLIFVLNGDYNSRPFLAAQLYQEGLSPQIAIARAQSTPAEGLGLTRNETDISVSIMEALGVPADRILVLPFPGGVTSTFDEARVLRGYLDTHPLQRVLLVTSAFHTRRARWIIDKELSPLPVSLEVASAPYIGFDQTNWWKSEDGLVTLNNEYIKLVYYLIKYH
jgi:uncharacterized SAM-binding protein YcdF (DUF218 family)